MGNLNRIKYGVAVLPFFLSMGAMNGASAQEEAGAQPPRGLDEVIVTATRTERDLFTTPFSGSVIDYTEFELYQPQNFSDVFDNIPGATVQGGSRRVAQEPNIRGFVDQQLLIRLDGARQNFDLAHRGRFFADNDLIKRIEVLRGGASSLFGSGAIGGVVSFETLGAKDLLRPDENWGARAKVGYQTNGEEPILTGGLFGTAGPFDALANFVYRDIKFDLEDGDDNPILNTAERVYNGLVKVGFEPTGDQRFEIIADIYDSKGDGPSNADDEVDATSILVGRDIKETNVRGNYSFSPDNNPWVNLKAVAYYSDVDVTETGLEGNTLGRFDETDFRSFGVDLANTSSLDFGDTASLALTYGFEYFRDEQSGERGQTNVVSIATRTFPDAERSFAAGFAQAELALFDIVSIVPGVRIDRFKLEEEGGQDRSESEFSPRIAVGVEPASWLYLWGSYSEAFRAPSLTELYNDGQHFQVQLAEGTLFSPDVFVSNEFVPTPDLEPEKAKTVEAGFRLKGTDLFLDNDKVTVSGTYFKADVDNFIDTIVTFIDPTIPAVTIPPFGPPSTVINFGTTQNLNVNAEITGFEGELKYKSTYLDATLLGSLADGDNKDNGFGLNSIPQNTTVFQLVGKVPIAGVQLGGRFTYAMPQRDIVDPATLGGGTPIETDRYETLDLFASWAPPSGTLEGAVFTIGGDNILDETFSVHPQVIRQPGRSFRASLRLQFGG